MKPDRAPALRDLKHWITSAPEMDQYESVDKLRTSLRYFAKPEYFSALAIKGSFVAKLATTLFVVFRLDTLLVRAHRSLTDPVFIFIEWTQDGVSVKNINDWKTPAPDLNDKSHVWSSNFQLGPDNLSPFFLRASRLETFSKPELTLLDLLATEIAMTIKPNITKRYLNQYHRGMQKATDSRANHGTVFAELTGKLAATFGVGTSLYFSTYEENAHLEYRADYPHPHARAKVVTNPSYGFTPAVFRGALAEGAPFFWADPCGLLNEASSGTIQLSGSEPTSLLTIPISSAGLCLGFWGLVFREEPRPPEEVIAGLDINSEIFRKAGYLMQRRFTGMLVEPIYRGRDTRVGVGKCAVLMPFTEKWSDRIWTKCVQPYVNSMGFDAIRADDLFGRDVMEDIWAMILSAEVVVADITGRNANVFYELGLAHAIGKHVILLTQTSDDIPFDLNRYRHVIYEDNADGYEDLQRGLSGALTEVIAARGSD